MHGSVLFWWLFSGQSILALCTCNMEHKWSHCAMFVQIKRIIDHNYRVHMSIRVLPSRGVEVSPQIAKVPLKSWKMKEMIILMWIKHIVLLPPSLSPIFSFETHIFTGGLRRKWRSRSRIKLARLAMQCACSSWGYHNWGKPDNSTHPSNIWRKCCSKWSTPHSRTPGIQCFK